MNSFSNNLISTLINDGTNFFISQNPSPKNLYDRDGINRAGLTQRIGRFLESKFGDQAQLVFNAWMNHEEGQVITRKQPKQRKKIPSRLVSASKVYTQIIHHDAKQSYILTPQIIQRKNGDLKIQFACKPLPGDKKLPAEIKVEKQIQPGIKSGYLKRVVDAIKSFALSAFAALSRLWSFLSCRKVPNKEAHLTFSDKYPMEEEGDIEIYPSDLQKDLSSSSEGSEKSSVVSESDDEEAVVLGSEEPVQDSKPVDDEIFNF